MRVQSVVQELRGEKIDIIPWTDDQVQFVRNALSPAKVARVFVHNDERAMQVIVPNDQLSLAIGKRGQNVRLAAKLTHWKIDIMSEDDADVDAERQAALRQAELAFQSPRSNAVSESPPQEAATQDGDAAQTQPVSPDEAASTALAVATTSSAVAADDASPAADTAASGPDAEAAAEVANAAAAESLAPAAQDDQTGSDKVEG
jgi:N utilization substance protein A